MTSRRLRRPKPHKPISARKLIRASLKDWRAGWKGFALILAIIVVPLDLLTLSQSLATNESVNAYASVALIALNAVLTWAIIEQGRTGKVPRPADAYYDGSITLVRYGVVSVLIGLTLIPAAFGAALCVASLESLDAAQSFIEPLLIYFVCLLLAFCSFWLLVRFIFAFTAVVSTDMRPLAAMGYSRRLTLGRFWKVAGRLASLVLFIVVLAIPIALITAIFGVLRLSGFAMLFFELATTLTAVPIANIYLLRLYRDLERQVVTTAETLATETPDEPEKTKPETDTPTESEQVVDESMSPDPEPGDEVAPKPSEPIKIGLDATPVRLSARRMDMVRPRHNLRYDPAFGEKIRRTK